MAELSPLVGIIVVHWNDAADTIACLDSLRAMPQSARRVYVVDNASTDGSPHQIVAAHPEVALVRATANRGYAAGFNLGCARALDDGAEYVWLLNNDTAVMPETLDVLLDAARAFGPAIYSPRIVRGERGQETWYAGGRLDWRLKSHHLAAERSGQTVDTQPRAIAWATGCSLFCAAATVRRIGQMDERYFLYLEDVDWCLRARAAGVPVLYVPRALVRHGVSRSVTRLDPAVLRYYSWRNYYLLVTEHGRWWQRLYGYANLTARFVKIGIRQAFFPAYRRDRLYQARTQGLTDFVRGRFGAYRPVEEAQSVGAAPREALT